MPKTVYGIVLVYVRVHLVTNTLYMNMYLTTCNPRQQIDDLEGKIKILKDQIKKKDETEKKYQGRCSLSIIMLLCLLQLVLTMVSEISLSSFFFAHTH